MAISVQSVRSVVERRASHLNAAFPKSFFNGKGLVSLLDTTQRLQRISGTAGCGTARPVVWEDGEDDLSSDPISIFSTARCRKGQSA